MDFRPVPRIFLFLGFVVFGFGAVSGFNLHNRTLLSGGCLLFFGLAGDYWPDVRYRMNAGSHGQTFTNWGKLALAVIFSLLAAAAAVLACRSS